MMFPFLDVFNTLIRQQPCFNAEAMCITESKHICCLFFIKTGDYCPVNALDINLKKTEIFKLNKEKKKVFSRGLGPAGAETRRDETSPRP